MKLCIKLTNELFLMNDRDMEEDKWEDFLRIKNRRLCQNPGSCPLQGCMAHHFSKRDINIRTLKICVDFPDCDDLDCIDYHPSRRLLNVCPRLHKCDRWYCKLDHPRQRKFCLESDCDCGTKLHRPQQSPDNNILNLPEEIMSHILQNLTFEEWMCVHRTCQKIRSIEWVKWRTMKKIFGSYKILLSSFFIKRGKLYDSKTYYCIRSIDMIWMRSCRLEICAHVYTQHNVSSTRFFTFKSIQELHDSFQKTEECPIFIFPGSSHSSPNVYMMGTVPLLENYWKGMKVDTVDSDGVWYPGIVREIRGNEVLIHYQGWADKWDEWIFKDSGYIAPLHMFTPEWGYDILKEGDEIDFRSGHKWYPGIITKKEKDVLCVDSKYHGLEFRFGRDSEEICPRSFHEHQGMYKKNHRVGKKVVWCGDVKEGCIPLLIKKHPSTGVISRVSDVKIRERMNCFFNTNIKRFQAI